MLPARMKLTDLEDHQEIVTKQYLDLKLAYLDLKLAEVRLEMQRQFTEHFRWNMGMFAGLYAVIILHFFK